MIISTDALVLRTIKYGDDKLIVDMFARQLGRVSFIVGMARGGRSRLRRSYFQPLVQLNVVFDHRPSQQLQRIKEVTPATIYATIGHHPGKIAVTMFVAEFLAQALRGEQSGGLLYDFVADSLLWLDASTEHYANFHIVFTLRMARFLGFQPNLEDYREGDFFDLRAGCFTAIAPPHTDVVAPAEARLLGLLMRINFSTMHLLRLNRDQRNRIVELIVRYYRIHLPDFGELRTLSVLREAFN